MKLHVVKIFINQTNKNNDNLKFYHYIELKVYHIVL
jgi:hypothetical protein